MKITRRVFVSMPGDKWLTPQENELKWAIVKTIEKLGYQAEIFFDPRGKSRRAGNEAWSGAAVERIAASCSAAAILGFPRWKSDALNFATEYCHYEAAIAHALDLPLLVLVQDDVQKRVVFDRSFGGYIGTIPVGANTAWLRTPAFRTPFRYWKEELKKRRDLFLGYCSSSTPVAKKLKRLIQQRTGATVLDWQTDFSPGRSILAQVDEASSRCSAGVFLFTRDDKLANGTRSTKAVPRDNVVFEAGYFIRAKGKDRVLIVREGGAKMPADLGGDIYAALDARRTMKSIEPALVKFVAGL